eukprot:7767702-Alexandrium_andersonii.AAC.1
MQFVRAAKSKFPIELTDAYKTDKLDLFRTWLKEGKDISKVAAKIRRTVEKSNDAKDVYDWVKKSFILTYYNN